MTRRRWSDNDHNLGPFTYAKDKYGTLEFLIGSGDGDEYPGCYLRLRALGHTFIVNLPPILRPWREKVVAKSWDASTVERLGRDWYWNYEEREYGVSYSTDMGGIGGGGYLQIYYGRNGMNCQNEQRWSSFTPWNNWRHVRHSMYGLAGEHYWTDKEKGKNRLGKSTAWDLFYSAKQACPTRSFAFLDFDSEPLTAKTLIEERQWELGTGWFKWLSKFKKPIIRRSLDITFSGETGKRKGSWKGGTIGTGIEMLPGELHESAFKRYCETHEMKFKGEGICTPQ